MIAHHTRPDHFKAQVVDAALVVLAVDGRGAAARFLEAERLPFRVIVRVLSEPGQRRAPRQR